MKHYDTFENIKYDGTLLGEEVWAFNKLDGQNFCAKFSPKQKSFTAFGSKTQSVDESSLQFGDTVRYFKENMSDTLTDIILSNSKKGGIFTGVQEITVFCEWYGDNSFSGFHVDGDMMHLAVIDVNLYKKGYIEPKPYYKMFSGFDNIELPELIYQGKLTQEFIKSIQENDWTKDGCLYPTVKEGVVVKRSTLMKGQHRPQAKIKTKWWLNELKARHPDNWEELE
jgi:hypothetical protein